ncbi:MAG: glycosyltransferase [Eubacteriales bacterium]|nr:glycosyltransferase [Eubacteriales bacterium]
MKILWVVSSLLPQIARLTGEAEQPFGGWLVSALDDLLANAQNEITVCYRAGMPQTRGSEGQLSYCSFRQDLLHYSLENETLFSELLRVVHPDVIHIWGTEYPSALAMVRAAEREQMLDRVAVSIQGLCSVYAWHYEAGLPAQAVKAHTLRDWLRRDNIDRQREKFGVRGAYEVAALQKVKHVVGRTRWDQACARQINPNMEYHFCNETLREPFYEGSWNVSSCERHTIFVSQGDYPIKGLHKALAALAYLKKDYPDVKLVTTGKDPRVKGLRARLLQSSYARYLERILSAWGLDANVEFLGSLSAEQMKRQYLRAHVALNPSSVENSSNAICEAMLLGLPVVASYVGGTPDLISDGVSGLLYPFDAPYLLSDAVRQVFSSDELAARLSSQGRYAAAARHDRGKNLSMLLGIYRSLAKTVPENS